MPPYIEFEGKNVEEAVIKACGTLNISRDQLKHEIVRFGATGIFGLVGFKRARIRVSIPDDTETEHEPESEFLPDITAASNSLGNDISESSEISAEPKTVNPVDVSQDDEMSSRALLMEKSANTGRHALQRMVDAITDGAEVNALSGNHQIVYTISGGNPAALIGKRGQTFEAIRHLMKQVVNKSAESRMRIVVEIADHTPERRLELQKIAQRFAEKACQNGRSVTVGRFSPQDRKTIHLALKDDKRIKTQSRGEGYLKKLVVIPREM
jgi:spoIIIJ-associated protein